MHPFESKEQKQAKQSAQLKERQTEQIEIANGQKDAELVDANRSKKGHKVRKHEADAYVHVEVMNKNLTPDQKNFVEDKSVVKIHAREFDRRVQEGAFATYDQAEVIHDPRIGAPKTYSLKPENLQVSANGPAPDKNVALREQKLKQKEEALDEKLETLNESWKKQQETIVKKNETLDAVLAENKKKSDELDALLEKAKAQLATSTTGTSTAAPVGATEFTVTQGPTAANAGENNVSATGQPEAKTAPKPRN